MIPADPRGAALLAYLRSDRPLLPLVQAIFAAGGVLERAGCPHRPVQVELAVAIARRVDAGAMLLGEAPCGTGKSYAYLVPGVLAAVRADLRSSDDEPRPRLVISTANIALQDQLLRKDVPAVARMLGVEVRTVIAKGRRNWVCREALAESSRAGFGESFREVLAVREWVGGESCTGDKEDLPFAVSGEAWSRVTIDGEDCDGDACPSYATCFAEAAKRQMAEAHVVVCNHHWLALAGHVVRPAAFLVIDEAHALEDALREAGRIEIRDNGARRLVRKVEDLWGKATLVQGRSIREVFEAPIHQILQDAEQAVTREKRDRVALPPGWSKLDAKEILSPARYLCGAFEERAEELEEEEREKDARLYRRVGERIARYVYRCSGVLRKGEGISPWAVWAEQDREGKVQVLGCPIDVAPAMRALVDAFPASSLVSATLAPSGSFEATRFGLGLDDPRAPMSVEQEEGARRLAPAPAAELVLPSPWPLARMGVLVVPRLGPGPKAPEWPVWAAERVVRAVREAEGRTLVLASSMRAAKLYAQMLRDTELPWPVRLQGEAGRSELRTWFRDEVQGVLVATRSFFEGLDVVGESCSCVVLDRIPFEVPDDPLESSICAWIEEVLEDDPFSVRSLPKACAVLQQGSGRLLRAISDRGAIVLLDNRYWSQGMVGEAVRAAFPPFPVSMDLADIGRFLRREPLRQGMGFAGAKEEPVKPKNTIRLGGAKAK